MAQTVKSLPAMQETQVQSLGRKDPLSGNPSSILAWRIPLIKEGPGGYSPWGHKEVDTTEQITRNTHTLSKLPVLSIVSFTMQKLLSLVRSHFNIFAFVPFTLGDRSEKYYCDLCQRMFCL